jgi:hypothetical protein
MAIPNPFYRHGPNTRQRWGYTCEITDEHMTPKTMQPLRFTYDKKADECLERLYGLSPVTKPTASTPSAESEKNEETSSPPTRPDLFTLLRDNHSSDPILSRFWEEITTVPKWVDWAQIGRGQDMFYRYGGANLTGLAFQSLLGGMGAARVVETLSRTGAFSTKTARRRLYETTQHILQVTDCIESVKPGGRGWESSIRVRLLHSAIRLRILKLEKETPGYYNVEAYGIPVNDLDSIATIATFSSSLIWQSLPRQGIFPTTQEATDYVALWRYIGWLFGTPTDPYMVDAANAKRTFESLILFEIDPSPTSRILAFNLIAALSNNPPIYASPDMLFATARWLIGHELSDALDLGRPSWYYYILMVGQCFVFIGGSYSTRLSKSWDIRKQQVMRKAFWTMIVDSKHGLDGRLARYEMKWIPKLGKTTIKEAWKEREAGSPSGIEMRNLRAFLAWIFGFIVAAWFLSRIFTHLLS